MAVRRPRRQAFTTAVRNLGFEDISSANDSDSEELSSVSSIDSSEEIIESENQASNHDWHFTTCQNDCRPTPLPEFTGCTGVNPSIQCPETPDDNPVFFLDLFLTDEILASLTLWSNNRVWQAFDEEEDGNLEKQHLITETDLKKFFAILFAMALNKKPTLQSYWSKDPIFRQEFFALPESLSRARFTFILKYLRFADYTDLGAEYLCKILPSMKLVNERCSDVYIPEKEISVDETLMLYKGRLHIRQYLPNKRSRYGVKTFVLAESTTGYVHKIVTNSVSNENRLIGSQFTDASDLSFSEKIVLELSAELLDQGYHLYLDNFYGSFRLGQYLLKRKTLMTCTVRPRRGPPEILLSLQVPIKSHAYARHKNTLCVKMVDQKSSGKKTVYLLDTSSVAESTSVTRKIKGNREETVEKPCLVLRYNANMGGVDLLDASLHHYDVNRKSYSWFVKYGLHLIHIMHRNSWSVYRHSGGTLTYLDYTIATIRHWITQGGVGRQGAQGGRPRSSITGDPVQTRSLQSNLHHYPSKILPREGNPRPSKRCRVCYSEKNVRKQTVYQCVACDGNPGLCATPCFEIFHRK